MTSSATPTRVYINVFLAKVDRCAHPVRGRGDVCAPDVRVRAHGAVIGGGVVRRELGARLHTAGGRRLLLQAARATAARRLLGPHAARRHDGHLHDRRIDRRLQYCHNLGLVF